jgi:hypothetical protein
MNLLQERIIEMAEVHGSLRAAARVLQVDHGYLWRLMRGDKDNPDHTLLRKLGIRKIVTFESSRERTRV